MIQGYKMKLNVCTRGQYKLSGRRCLIQKALKTKGVLPLKNKNITGKNRTQRRTNSTKRTKTV